MLWPLVIYFFDTRSLRVVLFIILLGAPLTRFLIGEYPLRRGACSSYR